MHQIEVNQIVSLECWEWLGIDDFFDKLGRVVSIGLARSHLGRSWSGVPVDGRDRFRLDLSR